MTYKHDFKCSNCEVKAVLEIPKGTTIKDFLVNHVCSNCGCGAEKVKSLQEILKDLQRQQDGNKAPLPYYIQPNIPIFPRDHHGLCECTICNQRHRWLSEKIWL